MIYFLLILVGISGVKLYSWTAFDAYPGLNSICFFWANLLTKMNLSI